MSHTSDPVNVASLLAIAAARDPDGMAIAEPVGRDHRGQQRYRQVTLRELDDDSHLLAAALARKGVRPGTRIVLMVRPSIDFISLVFALFKAGVITVLIDPGMGRRNAIRCLQQVDPEGFIAIPVAQALRTVLRYKFPKAKFNVTVGRRWFWGGTTLAQLRQTSPANFQPVETLADDPAAIIFTTGSTGPPKGVLYRHGNFATQATEIRDRYSIQPGEIDLPCFPLFALFNCGMGVSTVIPVMDPTKPAEVDPRNVIEPIRHFNITQAFGSPALWNTVSLYCEAHDEQMPSLRRALSAGAPVPPHVLRRLQAAMPPEGEIYTPYGATEALPVASIAATDVLDGTERQSQLGAGTCVGSKFPGIQWRVIRITDEPIAHMDQAEVLELGEIGELVVQGPVVTTEYATRPESNALHKISDGDRFWHRMGDTGYLAEDGRFWFCGRKSHRVQTESGTLYTIPCEAIPNAHDKIYRSALVGIGPAGQQHPIMIAEPWPAHWPKTPAEKQRLGDEIRALLRANERTRIIEEVMLHKSLPVDIRHNAKIFREQLAPWAAQRRAQ